MIEVVLQFIISYTKNQGPHDYTKPKQPMYAKRGQTFKPLGPVFAQEQNIAGMILGHILATKMVLRILCPYFLYIILLLT